MKTNTKEQIGTIVAGDNVINCIENTCAGEELFRKIVQERLYRERKGLEPLNTVMEELNEIYKIEDIRNINFKSISDLIPDFTPITKKKLTLTK